MTEFVPFECQACHHGYVRMVAGTNRVMPYCREFGLVVPDDLLIPTCDACRETFQNVEEAEAMAKAQLRLLRSQYLAVLSSAFADPILRELEREDADNRVDAARFMQRARSGNRLVRFFQTLTPEDEALLKHAEAVDAGEDPKT